MAVMVVARLLMILIPLSIQNVASSNMYFYALKIYANITKLYKLLYHSIWLFTDTIIIDNIDDITHVAPNISPFWISIHMSRIDPWLIHFRVKETRECCAIMENPSHFHPFNLILFYFFIKILVIYMAFQLNAVTQTLFAQRTIRINVYHILSRIYCI